MTAPKGEPVPRGEIDARFQGLKEDIGDLAKTLDGHHAEVIIRLDRINGEVDSHAEWITRQTAQSEMRDTVRTSIRSWMVISISILVGVNGVIATAVTILTR